MQVAPEPSTVEMLRHLILPQAEPSAAPWRGYNSLDLVLYFPTYVQWGGVGLGILYFIVYINGIVKVSGV